MAKGTLPYHTSSAVKIFRVIIQCITIPIVINFNLVVINAMEEILAFSSNVDQQLYDELKILKYVQSR